MSVMPRAVFRPLCQLALLLLLVPGAAALAGPSDLESGLMISVDGSEKTLTLAEAMDALNIPSVSLALIDRDQVALARAYGAGATPETLYQAASLSKLVAAVGAMRLVDQGRLDLDEDVNARLTSWKVPTNGFDQGHPVTLRGLLSMTAGIGVPGFLGYELGAPLPNLTQILYGVPPANSQRGGALLDEHLEAVDRLRSSLARRADQGRLTAAVDEVDDGHTAAESTALDRELFEGILAAHPDRGAVDDELVAARGGARGIDRGESALAGGDGIEEIRGDGLRSPGGAIPDLHRCAFGDQRPGGCPSRSTGAEHERPFSRGFEIPQGRDQPRRVSVVSPDLAPGEGEGVGRSDRRRCG